MADELEVRIRLATKNGAVPEYIDALKSAVNTFRKRAAGAKHRGGVSGR